MKKLSKYRRYYSISFELNPFGWVLKPDYYRFKHELSNSPSREGSFQWLFIFFSWSRDLKQWSH